MKYSIYVIVAMLLFSHAASASDLIVYPAQQQTAEDQKADEGACFIWARDESGFDPLESVATVQDPKKRRGGVLLGAALGAAIGDSSDAAVTGAAIGGVGQGLSNKRSQKAVDEEQQAQADELAAARRQFNRANAACLEARGYNVK